jgi:hypothetical protein
MIAKTGSKERTSADVPSRLAARIGYAACAWAFLFAAAHYYWAFGGAYLVGESGVDQSRELLASDPWYYWTSWMVLGTVFAAAGLFPLALSRPRADRLPRWMGETLTLGVCGVLLLLVAALAASDGPSWTQAPFLLCAAGLALVRDRYRTIPRRALLAATGILGLGMSLYGVLGLAYASPWGPGGWREDSCSRRRPGGVFGKHAVPARKDRRT